MIGHEFPRQLGQPPRRQIKEHRRGQRIILGLDRASRRGQRISRSLPVRISVALVSPRRGIACHPDPKRVCHQPPPPAPRRCHGRMAPSARSSLAGCQKPILHRLPQARPRITQVQPDRRVRPAQILPVGDLTRKHARQICQVEMWSIRLSGRTTATSASSARTRPGPALSDPPGRPRARARTSSARISRKASTISASSARRSAKPSSLLVSRNRNRPLSWPLVRSRSRKVSSPSGRSHAQPARPVAQGKTLDQRGHQCAPHRRRTRKVDLGHKIGQAGAARPVTSHARSINRQFAVNRLDPVELAVKSLEACR